MKLHIVNSKESTKKIIRTNIKVQQGCRIQEQYTNINCTSTLELQWTTKNEINKIIAFIIASKVIKYLGLTLTKEV